jgi:predicted DNA-binding transcriptional regulator YafY
MPAPLLALARAAAAGRPVRLSYREAGPAPARQEVEVLSLGWRFGQWVALARDREGGGLRVLELGRVEAVRPVERRRRPRGHRHGARPRRPREAAPCGVDPLDFALADLQDPDAGPARRVTVTLPRALAALAGTLFAGAEVEAVPGGARVHLRTTNGPALAQMVASLGVALG